MRKFVYRSEIDCPVETLFDWHMRNRAFERLTPPWLEVAVKGSGNKLEEGFEVQLTVRKFGVPMELAFKITEFATNQIFVDEQTKGPFMFWKHQHIFEKHGDSSCAMHDDIRFGLPLHVASEPLMQGFMDSDFQRMFRYRHDILKGDLAAYMRNSDKPRKKVLITGSHGMLGSALVNYLSTQGHQVSRLVRSNEDVKGTSEIVWDASRVDPPDTLVKRLNVERFDAVIHLAGANIAEKAWTHDRKALIKNSRVESTKRLAKLLAYLNEPPQVVLSASGANFYESDLAAESTEGSPAGRGFLSEVCKAWESALQPARDAQIRCVNLRMGVILSPDGGALQKMLTPFSLGLGGQIGSGSQSMSWVSLDDAVQAIEHCMLTEKIDGPVNVTSPNYVTNKQFTQAMEQVIGMPENFKVPSALVNVMFGQMGKECLLEGVKAVPEKLIASGYIFRHQKIEDC
ncbi:MAG: TIGR01777 family protein, partial [Leptolyngbya sp.]|nr:TIGR01777 family protein [Candidatus Melainabacteria bacterium]